ncbi:putative signal transducing protein [Mariniflexile sp.]|uniref:putative signal transducing protein n=1 Tax=Mariniflexile sp. TaxID=1979402 RepID=UPI003562ECAF
MKDSNYIKIFTGNLINAQIITAALEKINISPVVKEQSESGLLTPVFGGSRDYQEIFVHKDEIEKASEILEGIKKELQL